MFLTKFNAEFSTVHYVSSQRLCWLPLLVFEHLRNVGQLQCKQVYKTAHKLVLAEVSECLTGNNI